MRFLLNPVRRSARAARKDCKTHQNDDKTLLSRRVSLSDTVYVKSWGQQCSPNCGCVIRFESKVDPSTQTIVESSYHAKSVIAVPRNGRLEPVYTTRTHKPMLKECKCKTLHTLAKDITSFLPNKKIDRVRNMTEFSSTRSSPAFRHAVLAGNQLPRTDTHCFDVLEEAFTAMIKGAMPKQRNNKDSFQKMLIAELVMNPSADGSQFGTDNSPRQEIGIDRTRLSLSSPRTMSTLRMFDINADYWDPEHQQYDDDNHSQLSMKTFDWISYVDELYQNEKSA
jgi:NifU-like protein involved in Fe-S cluster formation